MRSSQSKGKSPGLARPADKAAAIRKQRAAWLNREADAPDGAALPFAANPSPHQGERQRTHGAPQRSHFADSHHDAGADDGERIDEFAEQLREASATEQRHRDAEREKAMCDIRVRARCPPARIFAASCGAPSFHMRSTGDDDCPQHCLSGSYSLVLPPGDADGSA